MKKTVLFVTAGRTDLQLLLPDETGHRTRQVQIPHASTRIFHKALLNGGIKYCIDTSLSGKQVQIIELHEIEQQKIDLKIAQNARGHIILTPGKLSRVVAQLKKSPDTKVVAVIVFNTHRDTFPANTPNDIKEEPIAVGKVLAGWLAQEFDLKCANLPGEEYIGIGLSGWINYLDGEMLQEGSGRDFPLNREAVRRVDRIIQRAAGWQKDLHGCLTLGGGIPQFKAVVLAAAHYRFAKRISNWYEPRIDQPYFGDIAPGCQESLQAREHASDLLQKGDFAGAYGAVVYLNTDSAEQSWVRRLEQANQYFAGMLTDQTDLPDYLHALLKKPRCLLAAMRAEAALWAERIPEAIAWTCTFFDAALLDFIESRLEGMNGLDDLSRTLNYTPLNLEALDQLKAAKCLSRSGPTYKYDTMGNKVETWLSIIGSSALDNYSRALNSGQNNQASQDPSPKRFRNLNIHSIIPYGQMEQAQAVFHQCLLWSADPRDIRGHYFIGQPLACSILQELGVPDPATLYSNLLEGLQNDLANYEIR